jgi:hypothetical protein
MQIHINILFVHTKYGSLNDDLVKLGICSQVHNEYCFVCKDICKIAGSA